MTTIADLATEADAAALISSPRPAWIFKHSNTCSISHAAESEFSAYVAACDDPAGMLVVQTRRPLSNWVSATLKYTHQSPQLFLVHEGKVLWHASHWGITAAAMAAARAKADAPAAKKS
jgi:bacillithiol system protein YtxJ